MCRKTGNKIYLEAIKQLLFLSALLHMIILFVFLPFNKDLGTINYFELTGIDLLLPSIMKYQYIDIASVIFMICLYILILKITKSK